MAKVKGKMYNYTKMGAAGPFNPMPANHIQKPNYVKRIVGASDKVTLQNMEKSVEDYRQRILRNAKALTPKKSPKRKRRRG